MVEQEQQSIAHPSMSASRWDDCVVRVMQDNEGQTVTITGLNEAAEALLGYYNDDIEGKNLNIILADDIKEELQEGLDYVAGGIDLAQLLRKYNRFRFETGQGVCAGETVGFYILSNSQYLQFELLMRDATVQTALHKLYQDLYLRRKRGEIAEEELGLPNKEVFLSTIDLVRSFLSQRGIRAVMGVMILEDYAFIQKNRGKEGAEKVIMHVADEFKRRCRDEDMIAYLGEGRMGAILFDCNIENAASAFARIHRGMTAQPYSLDNQRSMPIQVSIAYQEITNEFVSEIQMKQCVDQASEFAGQGGNIIRRVR